MHIQTLLLVLFMGPWLLFGQEIRIESGTQMVVLGAAHLVLEDTRLVQDGTFVPGQSTVTLSGTAAPSLSSLGGSTAFPLYRLRINKSAQSAQLDQDISIQDQLLFQSGNLDLQGHEIDLQFSGYLTAEGENKRLTSSMPGGEIMRQVVYSAPMSADSGNLGIAVSSSANLGLTTIRRGHFPASMAGGSAIERYIDVQPTFNTGLNATLRMYYFDQELNGLPETDLLLFSSTNSGVNWNPDGFSSKDMMANYLELTGINTFAQWTAATYATFPVEWLAVEASPQGETVLCQWTIAAEEAVTHYRVERASLQGDFESVASVAARGIRQEILHYEATDPQPHNGENVYRIVAVHEDGSELLSRQVSVWFDIGIALSVFPNPSQGDVWLRYSSPEATQIEIRLMDTRGKALFQDFRDLHAGTSEHLLSFPTLAAGVYLLRVRDRGAWRSIQLMIQTP